MKILLTFVLSCLVAGTGPEVTDVTEGREAAATVPDCSVIAGMPHPRVMMTADAFNELKAAVSSRRGRKGELGLLHNLVIAVADDVLEKDVKVSYKLDASGKRLLSQSREALRQLYNCSYAYMMTGNRKYLDHVVGLLDTVCAFKDWHPSHYLDTGEMALGVAVAYDWLYDSLPEATRNAAREALYDYVLMTAPSQGFYSTKGNWNQVCNAGVMAAAVAVYDSYPKFARIAIEKGITSNAKAIQAIYAPDGNYPEGYAYWGYGTAFQVAIIELLKTVFGSYDCLGDLDCYFKSAEFMRYMVGVGGIFPYADGGSAKLGPNDLMWWFASEMQDPWISDYDRKLLESGAYKPASSFRTLPMVVCAMHDGFVPRRSKKARHPEIWSGKGTVPVAIVHTGWNFDDGDRYIGIKGGAAAGNHGHLDAGSFVYDALGVRWSEDFIRPDYATMENELSELGGNFWHMAQDSFRWDHMKMNNLGHSTISCSRVGAGSGTKRHPTDHIAKGKAEIVRIFDNPDTLGASLDMTPVLSDAVAKASRTITLASRENLVVEDVITACDSAAVEVQWRMVTRAEAAFEDGGIRLTKSGKTMHLDAGEGVEYCIWPYARPKDWEPRHWNESMPASIVGYKAVVPAGATISFVTVLRPETTQK